MIRLSMGVVLTAAACSSASAGSWFDVFDELFESGVPGEITGAGGLEAVPGDLVGLGSGSGPFGGNLFRNAATGNPAESTVLTISNLPSHDALSLSFLMVLVDSWDSTNGSVTPDYFNVAVDGVSVLQTTSNNATGTVGYGGDLLYSGNAGWGSWIEKAFDMSGDPDLTEIAHTADSVTIEFFASGAGWQGSSDESWAIDNLKVSVRIPAPSVLACAGLGLLATGRRRR